MAVGELTHFVAQFDRERCERVPLNNPRPLEGSGLQVVPPDASHQRTGPARWWLDVSGTSPSACLDGPSDSFVVEGTWADERTYELEVYLCQSDAPRICRPGSALQAWSEWHDLGELAPGTYRIVAEDSQTTFVVP